MRSSSEPWPRIVVALVDAFIGGLSQRIKEQLITLELPEGLDEVISIVNKIDCQVLSGRPHPQQELDFSL